MATPAQRPSLASVLPMLVKKRTSSPSISSNPFLFVALQNTMFKSLVETWISQIGKNVNNKFSLHNSSNRNGEHLTDFTLENRLTCWGMLIYFLANDEYENFVNAHLEAAAECISTKQRAKPRVPWETTRKSPPNAIGGTQYQHTEI